MNVVGDLGVILQYDTACSLDSCIYTSASGKRCLTLVYDACYMSKSWAFWNESNFVSGFDCNFRSFLRVCPQTRVAFQSGAASCKGYCASRRHGTF